VYSEVGQGTTIKIYFQRADKKITDVQGGSETILVVEDEQAVQYVTTRILMESGYTVYEAVDGEDALHIVRSSISENIHLLITDVVMPRMGGKELSQEFCSLYPDTKVLFVSGYTDNSIVEHGMLDFYSPTPSSCVSFGEPSAYLTG